MIPATVADVAVRSSIVLGIALAACTALRHRSAAVRHLVLASGICSAAIVGPLTLVVPSWTVPLARSVTFMSAEPLDVSSAPSVTVETDSPAPAPWPAGDVVRGTLTLGVSIAVGCLLIGF